MINTYHLQERLQERQRQLELEQERQLEQEQQLEQERQEQRLAQRQKHFEGYGFADNGQALPAEAELWFDPSSPNVINFFDSVESEPPFAFEWSLVADMASGILHGHPDDDESDYGDDDEGPIDPIEDLK